MTKENREAPTAKDLVLWRIANSLGRSPEGIALGFPSTSITSYNPVLELWVDRELPVTYWVLVLSGANQDEEMMLAQTLLVWAEFFAKDSVRLRCVEASERAAFRCCFGSFGITSLPALVFGTSPGLEEHVRLEPELLLRLNSEKGGLHRFVTKFHGLIENGVPLAKVKGILLSEVFWRSFKIAYAEIKGLVSISVSKDA